jgi:hemolysin III
MRSELVPVMRGVTHFWAFWCALAATIPLVALAPGGSARGAAIVYGSGMCVLFAGSATFHRMRCGPRLRSLLCRIDHSAIFIFIAASYTPVTLLVLDGPLGWTLFAAVWAGALAGVTLSMAWISAPRVLFAGTYVALGWVAIVAMPELVSTLPATPLILIAAGGVLYTAGAVVYARRRPDPWPDVFGFHEVFHALVIVAAALHFVAMAGWIIPAG